MRHALAICWHKQTRLVLSALNRIISGGPLRTGLLESMRFSDTTQCFVRYTSCTIESAHMPKTVLSAPHDNIYLVKVCPGSMSQVSIPLVGSLAKPDSVLVLPHINSPLGLQNSQKVLLLDVTCKKHFPQSDLLTFFT